MKSTMRRKYLPMRSVDKFFLLGHLLIFAVVVHVGTAAFVPIRGNPVCGSCRSFVPRSFRDTQRLFYSENNKSGISTKGTSNRRGRKSKGTLKKINSHTNHHHSKNAPGKKISRPTSFAAIRKELRKDDTMNNGAETAGKIQNVIDSATLTRIGKKRYHERQREQKAKLRAKEERQELKVRAYELSIETERGFQSTPQQAKEMKTIIDRLTELNPSTEPAWSYYGKTNPLTRQLYQSLANQKGQRQTQEEEETLASLEGKWILTYTNVPSIVSLATDNLGFAKLGRIGQECTPFPDYTVRTIIEWKRPDWVHNLETSLPGGISKWLFGKEESSVLQITTLRAKATPDDPSSLGISKVPRVFEVVSSKSSTALYDDDEEEDAKGTLSFVTDDGFLALDPLKPLKIGLQMAGRDGDKAFSLGDETHGNKDHHHHPHESGTTNLVTKDGLVALNPFQPWTVGLQMAGFARREKGRSKSNEPWKIAETNDEHHQHHHHTNNLLEDIHERGLVEGVLKQTPIQLPTPDAVASLLGDNDEESTTANSQSDRILYLDKDIRIIGDGQNHVTIESRACTDEDEDCWF